MATIRQVSNGRWEAVVEAGRGDDGRRRQYRRRFATRREATAGAAHLELEAADATAASRVGPTVADHCARWLEGRRGNLAERTYDSYEGVFRNHVAADPLGTIPIADLTPEALRAWMRRLADKPGRGGRPAVPADAAALLPVPGGGTERRGGLGAAGHQPATPRRNPQSAARSVED